MFFGGLFSYDLVAGFEDLPQLSAETTALISVFISLETLMVLTIRKKSTRIQASLFAPNEEEKQRLTARLNELRQQPTSRAAAAGGFQRICVVNVTRAMKSSVCSAFVAQSDSCRRNFPVVPSRRFSLPCPSPRECGLLRAEKRVIPARTCFLCRIMISPVWRVAGKFLAHDATSRQIEIYPIAGTRPRGRRADGGSLDRDSSTAASSWKCAPIIKSFPNT